MFFNTTPLHCVLFSALILVVNTFVLHEWVVLSKMRKFNWVGGKVAVGIGFLVLKLCELSVRGLLEWHDADG